MSVVICNRQCHFRDSSGCCGKDYVILNPIGICGEWFNKDGSQRAMPLSQELANIHPDTSNTIPKPDPEEAIPASEKE